MNKQLTCPYCGEVIPVAELREHPERYYTYAQGGVPWHDVCVRKVLAAWVEALEWLRKMRRGI